MRSRIVKLSAVSVLVACGAAFAQPLQGPQIYKLAGDSTFERGCFDPCLCPVMDQAPVRGTFKLTRVQPDIWFDVYEVTDVNWTVPLGDPELRITGSGEYRTGGNPGLMQRLQLDLRVGDGPVEHFDSGLIMGGFGFPEIDITIAISGIYCFDTVIHLVAEPVAAQDVIPYRLFKGTTYQAGCFDPCDCPLGPELPVVGSFGLVRLIENPVFSEYAVVEVRWRVRNPYPWGEDFRITGIGTYRVGGEFGVEHLMRLDLSVDGAELTAFSSGQVMGGKNFPRIDILISVNGIFCDDQVIDLHAGPGWSLTVMSPSGP